MANLNKEHATQRINQKFYRLTITEYYSSEKIVCTCTCGKTVMVTYDNLIKGRTRSCGCFQQEAHVTHDKSGHSLYKTWNGMKSRCYNEKDKSFQRYGARGITVCDRWLESLDNFISDMGERPTPNHSIDRIDNDGPYCKENCRWATDFEQMNNRRNTPLISFNGVTKSISQWALELNIPRGTIVKRLKKGWSAEKIILTPLNKNKSFTKEIQIRK